VLDWPWKVSAQVPVFSLFVHLVFQVSPCIKWRLHLPALQAFSGGNEDSEVQAGLGLNSRDCVTLEKSLSPVPQYVPVI
jgi:hypothetical protein